MFVGQVADKRVVEIIILQHRNHDIERVEDLRAAIKGRSIVGLDCSCEHFPQVVCLFEAGEVAFGLSGHGE